MIVAALAAQPSIFTETEVQDDCRVVVNSVAFDISAFRSIPKALLNSRPARDGGGFTDTHQKQQEKESKTNMEFENVEQLEQAYPELVKQIRDKATAAERARIKAIEDLALSGFETIVDTAKFEKPESAADVAMKIVAALHDLGNLFFRFAGFHGKGVQKPAKEDQAEDF